MPALKVLAEVVAQRQQREQEQPETRAVLSVILQVAVVMMAVLVGRAVEGTEWPLLQADYVWQRYR